MSQVANIMTDNTLLYHHKYNYILACKGLSFEDAPFTIMAT